MWIVVAEPVSKVSGAAKGLSLLWFPYTKVKCMFTECCDESWIHGNIAHKIQREVDDKLYGQHIAQEYVIRGIRAHVSKAPNKALVMSFHGWTGSGKNYVARMIAKSVFKNEMRSKFVHLFVATLHFPHPEEVDKYKEQLRSWIYGNLTQCERSLFIFDEIDKMPYQLMDVILPFIDYHEHIGGVDPRKSIFLFLSNGGMNAMVEKTLDYYHSGRAREDITYKEMEDLIKNSAFNEGEGGLKTSRLISRHLIDYFVPFLPLERKHVIMCFKDYLRSRGFPTNPEEVEELANQLHFFPKASPIYSVSGCKSVEQKVDFLYSEYVDRQHFLDDL
ncbi:torsin domain-containing protein [Ditylenchus destructor]|nr:torsin domain-containing protein [Ditylenchus destructor]